MKNSIYKIIIFFVLAIFLSACNDSYEYIIEYDNTTSNIPNLVLFSEIDICSVSKNYINEKNVEISVTTDEKYIFRGWELRKGNNQMFIGEKESLVVNLNNSMYKEYLDNGNLYIFACFDKATHVKFKLNGGVFKEEPKQYYDTTKGSVSLPMNIVRKGYYFVGWADKNGEIINKIPEGKNSAITLTATWVEDYRNLLINRVFEVNSILDFFGDDIEFNLTFEFLDDKYVNVFSNINSSYLNIGERYMTSIHLLTTFSNIANTNMKSEYNDWDFGEVENDGYCFEYKLTNDGIDIFLSSNNHIYSEYIEEYLTYSIYSLKYDVINDDMYFYLFNIEDENYLKNLKNWAENAMRIFNGHDPVKSYANKAEKGDMVKCNELTSLWSEIYSPIDFNCDAIEEGIYYINNDFDKESYIMLLTDNLLFYPFSKNDGIEINRYSCNDIILLRESFVSFQFLIYKNIDKYSLCWFLPMFGIGIPISAYFGEGIEIVLIPQENGFCEENGNSYFYRISKEDEYKYYWFFDEYFIEYMKEGDWF